MILFAMIALAFAAPEDKYGGSLIPAAPAPSLGDKDPFVWAEPTAIEILAGSTGTISLRLVVPTGTHVYRDMISVAVVDAGGLLVGPADLPAAMKVLDPGGTGEIRELYDRDVYVEIPVTVPKTATGLVQIKLEARHQGCKPGLCFPPGTTAMTALVRVKPG